VKSLILGGGGQLASDLQLLLGEQVRSYSHSDVDVCDPWAVDRAYREVSPDVVFNCSAFHNVDRCEVEPEKAWRVNVEAVRELAKRGVPLVHLSSNYVFDGRRDAPYSEFDVPSPRSVYAITKLSGEYAALAYGSRTLLVRTAGLYGLHGSASKGGNFVQRMIARAQSEGSLQIVSDQRLQPTFTRDLAEAMIAAVRREAEGIVHLTASGVCSWFEFTRAIMDIADLDPVVEPIQTTVRPGNAERPLNGVLARDRADSLGIPVLRHWRDALSTYIADARPPAPGTPKPA
jgi:dTDP-4-dehydrorhamnose reductase